MAKKAHGDEGKEQVERVKEERRAGKSMGASPLDSSTKPTVPAQPAAKKPAHPRDAEIRAGMKRGRFHNYYEKASGDLVQKVPIYFPIELVDRLKMRAIKERLTLSEIVRRAVAEYLGKGAKRET